MAHIICTDITTPTMTTAAPNVLGGRYTKNLTEDGVAVGGYDCVAYFTEGTPRKGDPAITATEDGAVYRFRSEANRDLFLQDPSKYAPAFGGICANAVADNNVFYVNPNSFRIQDGHLLLFYSDDTFTSMDKWDAAGADKRLAEALEFWDAAQSAGGLELTQASGGIQPYM